MTFDDTDYTSNPGPDIRPVVHELELPAGAQSEEARYGEAREADCQGAGSPSHAASNMQHSPIQSAPVNNPVCN